MNNLDHVKNFYPENYKMDLSETMKAALSKGPTPGGGSGGGVNVGSMAGMSPLGSLSHTSSLTPEMPQANTNIPGHGYVTEKLYMLLQLYLQNKGWNPSVELLQCFSELKDSAMLPSAAYLQVLANRLTLDAQGRLILRENGKIVLPFEHFANAVMLKHMSGPHGIHLSVDATVRAVIESYTIGRDNFGMEKEFIVEVVQSCPSPACRYYKNHMGISPLPFIDQQYPGVSPEFLQHIPHLPPPPSHPMASAGGGSGPSSSSSSCSGSVGGSVSGGGGEVDLTKPPQQHSSQKVPPQIQHLTKQQQNSIQSQLSQITAAAAAAVQQQQQQQQVAAAQQAAVHHQQQLQQQQQQQVAVAQQQAAAAVAAQQKQQQQQHAAQQQAVAAAAAAAAQQQQQQITAAIIQQQNRAIAQQNLEKFGNFTALEKQRVLQQLDQKHYEQNIPMAVAAAAAANLQMQGLIHNQNAIVGTNSSSANSNHHQLPSPSTSHLPPPPPSPVSAISSSHSSSSSSSSASHSDREQQQLQQINQKNVEVLRSNLESLESNKDLLALHNGAWGGHDIREGMMVGQEKIVRAFTELMRNMARMKTYIRPSMCKPYGKQSESLQKTLLDTIQLVQSLRNCLPAPHIPVSSWKSEDRHRKEPECPGIPGGTGIGVGIPRVENLIN